MVLKGDAGAMLKHADTSGLPEPTLEAIEKSLEGWRGVSPNLKLFATEVLTPAEFVAFSNEHRRYWPKDMSSAIRERKWNIQPEKIIVYKFEEGVSKTTGIFITEKPKEPAVNANWSLGVFQRVGAWFIAAGY